VGKAKRAHAFSLMLAKTTWARRTQVSPGRLAHQYADLG
jgi:hypothetical protein